MTPTDTSKTKYIIGNMVIPVTDEIQAKLKNDYSMEKLKKVFPAVFDRKHIMFLADSVRCVDDKGFTQWVDSSYPHMEWIEEEIFETRQSLGNIERILLVANQPKPNFFRRIFKRTKK